MNGEIPRLLNVGEAAQILGLSESWLNKARMVAGAGPVHLRLGSRVLYDPADLVAWRDAQKRTSTGEATPDAGGAVQ